MTFWVNHEGSCVACCVATLVGEHPADLPNDGRTDDDRAALNQWLQTRHGRRLEPIYGDSYDDMPKGLWIALLHRRHNLNHAVLARGGTIVHDPALKNGAGHIGPGDLAYAHDRSIALGWRLAAT